MSGGSGQSDGGGTGWVGSGECVSWVWNGDGGGGMVYIGSVVGVRHGFGSGDIVGWALRYVVWQGMGAVTVSQLVFGSQPSAV